MYYFGLDLGQAIDYTALSVIQKVNKKGEINYHVRHFERFKLGTTYPDMILKLEERVNAVNIEGRYTVIADATGVGRPVIDLMRARKIKTVPVTITGGEKEIFDPDMGGWRVPKRNLVSNLQVLLQDGKLKFAEGMPFIREAIQELLNFKVKVTSKANDTYEAWREGDKDDLVLALAMAGWYAVKFGVTEEYLQQPVRESPWLQLKKV